ncbi:hypothetical protein [Alteribacillus bidgolensis]|uniref:MerR family transcriptional regulator n=1 Tax=Alteribacillus bidgolensis TaxID=930129 RepID=A0A1G8Q6K1_9BACI|nr:hypothetical protein [Alteribacillus bidgolensis]SDJ00268.1 hypothetical protein SAMN05216352_11816 [Alteribacillus bidgolensis]
MDTFKAFKSISTIILVVLLVLNGVVFFSIQQRDTTEGQELDPSEQIQELKQENERLRHQEEFQSLTGREEIFKQLEEQAERFAHLAFVQNVDEYQTRKNEAEEVMNEELFDRFYSAEMYGGGEVETDIREDEYFIKNDPISSEKMDVIIKLKHDIYYVQTDVEETSNVLIQVTFERQNDTWMATDLDELT